ncbi:SDR family NAD(P)-dependent oxidoreductase [Tundrisphaera sp. TA3]|uniref:SDR family NAD(P)-dependent oxidoreductase n=1 Tax=Tundrisphaera sp. TA3 TaxID=3435775 RepID=UPI003EBDEEA0
MSSERRIRTALITGGGRGLGRAIAERLAESGTRVGLVARTLSEVEATARAIADGGGEAKALAADVLDDAGLRKALGRFGEWAGGVCDTLVCAAGRFRGIGAIGAVAADEWWKDVETALRGAHNAIRETLQLLRASDAATISVLVGPGHNGELAFGSGYAMAQAGLVRLVECLAREFRPDGPAIYAVNPGLVPTDLTQHLLSDPEARRRLPRFNEAFAEGKEVGPEVVAEMVEWLAAERPLALSGRVVAAPATPTILETRLDRIEAEDLLRLRLR